MFPAAEFIITAREILLGLHPSLLSVAATEMCSTSTCTSLSKSIHPKSIKIEQGVHSLWWGKKSERETYVLLGVLAWSNIPQSQYHQLNLILKFGHPRALKRNLYGGRTTFQFH